MRIFGLIVFVMFLSVTVPAYSAIFTYVDDEGKKWYVNDINQVPDRYHSQIKSKYKDKRTTPTSSKAAIPKKSRKRTTIKTGSKNKASKSSGGASHKPKKRSKKRSKGS